MAGKSVPHNFKNEASAYLKCMSIKLTLDATIEEQKLSDIFSILVLLFDTMMDLVKRNAKSLIALTLFHIRFEKCV